MHLTVSTAEQKLTFHDDNSDVATYPVSTSKFGLGEKEGSHQTPRGRHIIAEKIGAGAPPGTVFKGRIPTGEIWTPDTVAGEDLILTRILWLSGEEAHNANSHDRYIYFHGTNQEALIGTPASIGCIRLTNADIIRLFDRVEVGTTVHIE
ncbi:MAG: L,D-transpeptidase [Verrucomicrobiota bacterium]